MFYAFPFTQCIIRATYDHLGNTTVRDEKVTRRRFPQWAQGSKLGKYKVLEASNDVFFTLLMAITSACGSPAYGGILRQLFYHCAR